MAAKRALITGITGQDGSYLAELLLDKGYEVHGMVRRSSTEKFERIEHLRDRVTLHQGDLLDQRSLVDSLRAARPDEVYNLAAMSFVAVSWIQPTLTAEFTGVGVTRLLEAVREVCPEARFYQASSSEMFGKVREVPADRERRRSTPARPTAWPRSTRHHITVNYRESYDLHATSGILFNHESPRRGLRVRDAQDHVARRGHAARADERAAARQPPGRARLGLREGLRRGDVADAPADEPGDFVIATGEAHSVQDCVDIAFDQAGVEQEGRVVLDPSFLRPAEVDHLIGDRSKAERELGWVPATSFEQLIRLMVDADYDLLRGASRSEASRALP